MKRYNLVVWTCYDNLHSHKKAQSLQYRCYFTGETGNQINCTGWQSIRKIIEKWYIENRTTRWRDKIELCEPAMVIDTVMKAAPSLQYRCYFTGELGNQMNCTGRQSTKKIIKKWYVENQTTWWRKNWVEWTGYGNLHSHESGPKPPIQMLLHHWGIGRSDKLHRSAIN